MDAEQFINDLLLPDYNLGWEMTLPERLVFVSLLERLRPRVALEVGSRNGGSLQVLSKLSDRVVCVDVDPTVSERLAKSGANISFEIGDSKDILNDVLQKLAIADQLPDFIHIDGDHTDVGAASDLKNVLSLKPKTTTVVLMHDTFNPDVRRGILSLDFGSFTHLQSADIDFMTGIFHTRPAVRGEMWGGFSVFILQPEPRQGRVTVGNYLQPQYEFVLDGVKKWSNSASNVN